MMRNIAVAVDGSEHAQRAVSLASEIAAKFGSTVHLLHVVHHVKIPDDFSTFIEEEHVGSGPETTSPVRVAGLSLAIFGRTRKPVAVTNETLRIIAEKALGPARDEVRAKGVETIKEEVLRGDPAEEILKYLDEKDIDILFTGRRGLSSLEGLVLGSVTTKLCSHSAKPVVTVT
jgi:nucleotide-binding universal stress UspA family protein